MNKDKKCTPSNCETCAYYVYDEEEDYYVCEMELDEDETVEFLSGTFNRCPYYRLDDEYGVVRKQN